MTPFGFSSIMVSINSTSEEVRRLGYANTMITEKRFPLIQLPRKSEALERSGQGIAPKVSINSTSEEVRSSETQEGASPYPSKFPLIQLPRKSEGPNGQPLEVSGVCSFH